MTEIENRYLRHCVRWLIWTDDEESAMEVARGHAERNHYELSNLPDLLQQEIGKHRAKKEAGNEAAA